MKIIQTSPLNLYSQKYSKEYEKTNLVSARLSKNFSPSFKEINPEIYKQMFDNKDMQKIIAIATAAATTAVMSVLSSFSKTEELSVQTKENNTKEQEKVISQLLEKSKRDDEIIQKLNQRIEELEKNISTKSAPNSDETLEETENNSHKEETFTVQFPKNKKAGRLPRAKEELKKIVTSLSLSEESAELLTNICKNLIENDTIVIEGQAISTNDIANDLKTGLQNAKDRDSVDDIINKLEAKLNNKKEKTSSTGVKIIGKMDVSGFQKPKRQRFFKATVQESEKVQIDNETSDIDVDLTETTVDGRYIYAIHGTPKESMQENLTVILKEFEFKQIGKYKEAVLDAKSEDEIPEKPKWFTSQPAGILDETLILSEVKNVKEKKNKHSRAISNEDNHPYENINSNNAWDVANAMEKDERFAKMFTTHGAMRFVDRFINFDSDEDIEKQCHTALNKLEEIIKKAIKEGVAVEKHTFTDKYNKKLETINIIISPKYFDAKARRIFGTHSFRIGICENQPDRTFYNTHFKQALIQTIFPEGTA